MSYQILERKNIYQGRVFAVENVLLTLPDDRQRSYDLVVHNGAVTVVPLDEAGCIWFVRQFRLGSMSQLLELPAGVLEQGEDPSAGAAREIREEIGMAAGELHPLGEFFMAPGYSTEHMEVFLASHLYPSPLQADWDEFLKVEKIPAGEALRMARQGQILDGKTLAALLLAETFLS